MLTEIKASGPRYFINHYGMLCIPLSLLIFFNQFGLRPGQIRYKLCIWLINIMFALRYLSLLVGVYATFILLKIMDSKPSGQVTVAFHLGVATTIAALFTFWIISCCKKYNVFCLIEDIIRIRRNNLHITNLSLMIFSLLSTIGVSIGTGHSVATQIGHKDLYIESFKLSVKSEFLMNIFFMNALVQSYTIGMLISNLTLLISFTSCILRNEFYYCLNDLEKNITDNKYLPTDSFPEMSQRYRHLISVVNKADAMFSVPVAIILIISFGFLCAGVYGFAVGMKLAQWYYTLIISVAAIMTLLPSLSELHHKVSDIAECFCSRWR